MKGLLEKIFGKKSSDRTIIEVTTKKVSFKKTNEQVKIYSDIDDISENDLRLLAADFYCNARLLEEKGYNITAVKSANDKETTITLSPTSYKKIK